MKNRIMQLAVVMGLTAATLSVQAKVLPEFMNTQQLTAWLAQHAAPAVMATQAPDEQTQFFTGKPYDAASGTYLFKYRTYNPNLARWTSIDPCGFPDGANNQLYAPIPTSKIDALGLFTTGDSYGGSLPPNPTSDMSLAYLAPAYFVSQSAPLSARACSWCVGGTTATIANLALNPEEQALFTGDPAFGNVDRYILGKVAAAQGDSVSFASTSDHPDVTFATGDLSTAIHAVTGGVGLDGTITPWLNTSDNRWYYNDNLTISFSDPYDFAMGDNSLVNVFARLDASHWMSRFSIVSPADWQVMFTGNFPE